MTIGVPLCPPDRGAVAPRERAQSIMAGAVYEWQPAPGVPPSCRLYTAGGTASG
ncbi:unnamed protein product [Staurois parvus]|uniref:Uncharacterized protein n=1 Tax=Staurois parvus TaxID=386267 RepID=A0ABN9D5H4_9NEOB|nr:unnamed protein product [Staurois parvus]